MRKILGFALIFAMALAPLALPSGLTLSALAQAPAPDPPARVGRLNYMNGPVSYAPGGLNQWAQATLNYPLTTGTALWTDQNGRAELHIGSTAIRMDETTELDLLNLDDDTTQLRVAQGTVDIGVLQLDAGERFEVATPPASIAIVRPGHYRVEVDENAVRIIVRNGQVDVETSSGTRSVYGGQAVTISDDGVYQMMAAPALDEFGRWALARQVDEERALQAAKPYVSPAMTGYEDLAPYGTWRNAGGYGAAWYPRVAPGWAPYRHGRWVWASPWGWTWVDEAPWGFAPFHYGRWIVIGGVWAWIPGPIVVRPVFAPALVVFIVIGESIGWFPLAPHEAYVPPYYSSPVYRRNVNINIVNINITNINVTNIRYTYRHEPRAVTIVQRGTFVQADRIGSGAIAPRRGDIDRGQLSAGAPMQPRVESMLGRPQGSGGSHRPPAVVEQRPVVVRHEPPAPVRPQVSAPGAQMRNVPVRPVNERRPAPQPQPAPARQPAPQQNAPAPVPQPNAPQPPQGGNAPQPRPQVVPPQPVPQPNAVPTPHRRRPNEPAPQPQQPNVPQPPQGGNAPQPRPQVVPPQPAPQPNAVPTPHRRRPNEPAPQPQQPNAPAPAPQQNAPAPAPQPNVPQPPQGGNAPQPRPQIVPPQPAPQPNVVPTPHPRRRPNEPAPQPQQPNAPVPAPQPQAPAPQPRPPIVQPAPEPNPMPTPHPGGVAPQPRPQQPVVPPPQPAPPREQPRVRVPQPAPTPQVNPGPQVRPAPQPPRGQNRQQVSCDERSPNYDPRVCPQNRSRRH